MTTSNLSNPLPRLQFIDMARSIAILLMLEGHFTGAALDDVYRDNHYTLYRIWAAIHGLTKPLFFIVTGLIFSYLLLANKNLPFRENRRVRLGLKRAAQLLFWGYLIQLNLFGIYKSLKQGQSLNLEWLAAFHVLQSLAFGIVVILLIYGLHALLKKGSMLLYYCVAVGLSIFFHGELLQYIQLDEEALSLGVQKSPHFWPRHAPNIIQNMFYGTYSDFSFVSTTPLILLGAVLGILIRKHEKIVREFWFGLLLIVSGLLFKLFAFDLMWLIDSIFEQLALGSSHFRLAHYSLARFGEVSMLIGLLIWLEKYSTFRSPWFLKIGQNTFAIYVVHIIILYGGIFGFGLKPRAFDHNLSPILAATISLSALLFFAWFTKNIEPLERFYNLILRSIGLKKQAGNSKK